MTTVTVAGGGASYPVRIGCDFLADSAEQLPASLAGKRCVILADASLANSWTPKLLGALEARGGFVVAVPSGEASKSFEHAERICEAMADAGLDRSSFVVALGGGVVGDLAGFVAAIYHRGIPWVNVPTTLLAMVDSAIGGKTAVNLAAGKNLVGAIHQPSLVLADIRTLDTLPPREFKQGFAEIIKHGIIRDAPMLDALRLFDRTQLEALITRNLEIKAAIVAEDERETTGTRALLNFGHTIGHAIERVAGYGTLLHGEAISLGIVAACRLSEKCAGFSAGETEQVVQLLEFFDLPVRLPPEIDRTKVCAAVGVDKKFEQGRVRFVVTPELGRAHLSSEVTRDDIATAVATL